MKKKLTMMLLALVVALGGTSTALLTGCNKPNGNGTGNVTENEFKVRFLNEDGSLIAEKKVKSGEKVEQVTPPAKAGYTAEWVDKDGNAADLDKGVTADAEYKVKYTAKTDVEYKVEHYVEKTDGTYELEKTETKKGTTATTATAEAITKEHYTLDEKADGTVKTGEIKGDGSLVLKLYYKLDRVTVTFMADGTTLDTMEVRYGAVAQPTDKAVPPMDQTVEDEFVFSHWSATENGTTPFNWQEEITESVTVYAVYNKTKRTYYVSGVFGEGTFWYLSKDTEGNTDWRDEENYTDGKIGIKYDNEFAFAVYADSEETHGTPVVTAVTLNADGTEGAETTLEAADGIYTVKIKSNVKIKVTGIELNQYELKVNAYLSEYSEDWAYTIKTEDIVLEITDKTGNQTYHKNALNTAVTLTPGLYTAKLVMEDGQGGYTVLAELAEIQAYSSNLEDGKIVVEGEYTIFKDAYPIKLSSTNWELVDGKVTPKEDGPATGECNAYFTEFVPGTDDFVVTATFKLDTTKANTESDPTFGFTFNDGDNEVFPCINQTGIRTRSGFNGGKQENIGGLFDKFALGKAADHYDKFTEIVVKKGGEMFIFASAERTDNAGIAKVDHKLIAVITKNGIVTVSGRSLTSTESTVKMFEEGIQKVKTTFQMSTSCYGTMYGYAYSTDADVVESYLSGLESIATVKVDGTSGESVALGRYSENTVSIDLEAGKIVKTVTVNGEKANYTITDDGIEVYVNTAFTGTYAIEVTTEAGTYAKLTGTVEFEGETVEDAKVIAGGSVVYTDENGKFEVYTVAAESYEVIVQKNGYKQIKLNVTDVTKAIKAELQLLNMGDSAILAGKEYGATSCGITTIDQAKRNVYEQGYDANGNETYTSVSTSGYRYPLMFRNIAHDKFIVKAAIKYNEVKDPWIRIGFVVRNAEGKVGTVMFHGQVGKEISHTIAGWNQYPGLERLPKAPGGSTDAWKTGKWEVAMAYDNGKADLYLRNTAYFGTDKWYHLYSDKVFQGTQNEEGKTVATNELALEGPVVVGIYETQNVNTSFVMQDIYVCTDVDSLDNQITFANTDKLDVHTVENGVVTVKAKEGYEISDIKIGGNSYLAQATNENGTYTLTMPGMWMVDGPATVEVITTEKANMVAISGKVTVAETFGSLYSGANAKITFKNDLATVEVTAGEDGTYSIPEIAKGTYTVTATTGELKTTTQVEITGAATDVNIVLNEKDKEFYKNISGSGIVKAENADELETVPGNAGTTDTAFTKQTFVPNKQILEMQYTLTGNISAVKYPWIGFFVGDNKNVGRVVIASCGDQVWFLAQNDWFSRLGANEQPWTLWKGGFLAGQTKDRAPNGVGVYDKDAKINLSIKVRIDGYKISMWVKGNNYYRLANTGEWNDLKFEDWTLCFENLNIYDRYNTDGLAANAGSTAKSHVDTLYKLDQNCYFGLSHRQDNVKNDYKFTNIAYTITDREQA